LIQNKNSRISGTTTESLFDPKQKLQNFWTTTESLFDPKTLFPELFDPKHFG
jgi:hypothetical protein